MYSKERSKGPMVRVGMSRFVTSMEEKSLRHHDSFRGSDHHDHDHIAHDGSSVILAGKLLPSPAFRDHRQFPAAKHHHICRSTPLRPQPGGIIAGRGRLKTAIVSRAFVDLFCCCCCFAKGRFFRGTNYRTKIFVVIFWSIFALATLAMVLRWAAFGTWAVGCTNLDQKDVSRHGMNVFCESVTLTSHFVPRNSQASRETVTWPFNSFRTTAEPPIGENKARREFLDEGGGSDFYNGPNYRNFGNFYLPPGSEIFMEACCYGSEEMRSASMQIISGHSSRDRCYPRARMGVACDAADEVVRADIVCSAATCEYNNAGGGSIRATANHLTDYYTFVIAPEVGDEQGEVHFRQNVTVLRARYDFDTVATKSCLAQTECTFPLSPWRDSPVYFDMPEEPKLPGGEQGKTEIRVTCRPRVFAYLLVLAAPATAAILISVSLVLSRRSRSRHLAASKLYLISSSVKGAEDVEGLFAAATVDN